MPAGDRTGPMGEGPMTGRGAGYCSGSGQPGYVSGGTGMGRGFGMGFGRGAGRGWRHWFRATGLPGWMRFGGYAAPGAPQAVNEAEALEAQADALQAQLDSIKSRLARLGGGSTSDE